MDLNRVMVYKLFEKIRSKLLFGLATVPCIFKKLSSVVYQ